MGSVMKHTVYQTTNILNDVFYVGSKHSTEDPNDSYLGSGKHLLRSIKKYSKENFHKSILFISDNEQESYEKEFEIIQENINLGYKTYNIALGGNGVMTGRKHTEESKKKISENNIGVTDKHNTKETKEKISKTKKENQYKHSEETRQKISKSNTGKIISENVCNNQSKRMMCNTYSKGKSQVRSKESKEKNRIMSLGNQSASDYWNIISPSGLIFEILNIKKFCKNNDLLVTIFYDNKNGDFIKPHHNRKYSISKNTVGWYCTKQEKNK